MLVSTGDTVTPVTPPREGKCHRCRWKSLFSMYLMRIRLPYPLPSISPSIASRFRHHTHARCPLKRRWAVSRPSFGLGSILSAVDICGQSLIFPTKVKAGTSKTRNQFFDVPISKTVSVSEWISIQFPLPL